MRTLTLPIRFKVPAAVIGLSLVIALAVEGMGYLALRGIAVADVLRRLDQAQTDLAEDIQGWSQGLDSTAISLASNPTIAKGLGQLKSALADLGDDPLAALVEAYVTLNPHPEAERWKMDKAAAQGGYHFRHAALHKYLSTVVAEAGLQDVFLITPEGDILYSYAKHADFATNLLTGAYRDTGLGRVFQTALAAEPGTSVTSDYAPYAAAQDRPAMFVATAVVDSFGSRVGVLAIRVPFAGVIALVQKAERGLGTGAQVYVVGTDGLARTDLAQAGIAAMQPVADLPYLDASARAEDPAAITPLQGGGTGLAVARAMPGGALPWVLATEIADDGVFDTPLRFLQRGLAFGAIILIVIGTAGLVLTRSITRPLARLSATLTRIKDGALDEPVPDTARRDEIGKMAHELDTLREKLWQSERQQAAQAAERALRDQAVDRLRTALQALAQGDLGQRIDTAFPHELETLRADFNRAIGQLHQVMSDVIGASAQIGRSAETVGQAATDLSRRTETQAATLEETAAALQELTQSVRQAADSAQDVERIVLDARAEADDSAGIVKAAAGAMTGIEQSSSQIAQIIGVIDEIAFQTNLLALNAGVEAARAGEAGRGFAVVATEVRSLAQRSSAAAQEIKQLISTSTRQVEDGVSQVGKTGAALTRIAGRVQEIAALVSGIARAAQEQSTGLAEVNTGMMQLDTVTQQNAAMSGEVEMAGRSMADRALGMERLVAQFRTSGPAAAAPAPPANPVRRRAVAAGGGAMATAAHHAGWEDF